MRIFHKKVSPDELTLIGHLAELRRRLLASVLALAGGVGIAFFYSETLLQTLLAVPGELIYLAPGEAFFTRLRLAAAIGACLAAPMILFQLCAFILPALTREERRYIYIGLPAALLLFVVGVFFAYTVLLPLAYAFFLGFGSEQLTAQISVGSYLSFVFGLVFPFGLVFQLPLLVVVLTGIGVITPQFLSQNRKFAILATFVLAALLTPPDILSQLLMAGPLWLLFEVSVVLSRAIYWRKRRANALP